jgi:hypothetical protein
LPRRILRFGLNALEYIEITPVRGEFTSRPCAALVFGMSRDAVLQLLKTQFSSIRSLDSLAEFTYTPFSIIEI